VTTETRPDTPFHTVSHAIFRVARLHKLIAANLLRRTGLYPNQELVMMQLWNKGPQRQADLVKALGSDAASMTRTIQRLERAGFVRRSPSPGDRRATIVDSTTAGRALRAAVEDVWRQLEAMTIGELGDTEVAATLACLRALEDNLTHASAGFTQQVPVDL